MEKNKNFNKLSEENYVKNSENVIKKLREPNSRGKTDSQISTSKIRNLLSNISEIYNYITSVKDPKDLNSKVQYLKIQFVYEAGRDKVTRKFIDEAKILDHLSNINGSKEEFLLFGKYMEALVAYHRYYGGE